MSKFKKIILTIMIALLGMGLEVLNYYVFALNDKWYKVGIAMAGLYIVFISIFGNIMFYYYLDNKKGELNLMNKALMISIQPQHAVNILNGKKTLELRTWIPKDYVGWIYVYITKGKKDILHKHKDKYYINHYLTFTDSVEALNSKVVFRFWFDNYIAYKHYEDDNTYFAKRPQDIIYHADEVLKRLCLSRDEFKAYGKGKDLYAWHIKKLEIFDEPKSLSDFYVLYGGEGSLYPLKKAPQRSVWIYVEDDKK